MNMDLGKTIIFRSLVAGLLALNLAGCNFLHSHPAFLDGGASSNSGSNSSSGFGADPNYVAGVGATLSGTGAMGAPTANAMIMRLHNVMGADYLCGCNNFSTTIPLIKTNLANLTDPSQYTGADINMQLAYAACVDASGFYPNNWGIDRTVSAAANQAALVAAGLKMLDGYTAGLASGSSVSAQVRSALNTIVTNSINDGASIKTAFITVCTAANTAGSTLLGF